MNGVDIHFQNVANRFLRGVGDAFKGVSADIPEVNFPRAALKAAMEMKGNGIQTQR